MPKNNTPSVIIKIIAFLIISMIIGYFLPVDFLHIKLSTEAFQKYVNNDALSLPQLLNVVWNENIYILSFFTFRFIILLFLGFRFKKDENLRLSRNTAIIAFSCFALSAIGYSYKLQYEFLNYGLRWQTSITALFRYFITVATVEEVIYRSLITNGLFRLKQNGLKIPVAITISAIVFGLIHIDTTIINIFRFGYSSTFNSFSIFTERFIFPMGCGVSWAVILYYKKDIVTLLCIHAANNILSDSYFYTDNMAIGALYITFFVVFVVCYPAFLIFNASKNPKALHNG